MIIVSYDISNNKKRTRFSKLLEKYGERLQFSVFQIKNSQRVMSILLNEIKYKFGKYFDNSDSVFVFNTCATCDSKITKYGNALHYEKDVVYLD